MPEPSPYARALPALRVGFLLAVLLFAWLGLRGRFDEVGDALTGTSPVRVLGALALVLVGLLATGVLWRSLLTASGSVLPLTPALGIFFVGQLGKYIPGSVWSIGAQADLARSHRVPARATVGAGLLFLGYHVDTAVLLAAVTALAGGIDSPWPGAVSWLALAAAVVGLAPPLVRGLGRRVSGRTVDLGLLATVRVLVLMAVAWVTYAGALVLLSVDPDPGDLWLLGGAFAAAYAIGVLVVFAPAGVGAREAVFVLLLEPTTGVAAATALALLARVVHTAADVLLAAGWWTHARRSRTSS